MAKKKRMKLRLRLLLAACVLLLLIAGACLLRLWSLSRSLPSQLAAERWQGESEQSFSQISCFLPADEPVGLKEIYDFRTAMMDEFHKAALDAEGTDGLWKDAWSAVGKVTVTSARSSGEAACIAVGGDFFAFHPLRLLSGSYFGEGDLMKDLVLLDEDLAWLLFGGTQLQGMSVEINGKPFIVGGVIEREQDSASTMAYTSGQGLFMSYEGLLSLGGSGDDTKSNSTITCYEAVMAEPVRGFAARVAKDRFPLGRGEVLTNTGRFGFDRLLQLLRHIDGRSMQSMGILYPYWENAARVTEDRCARLLLYAGAALLLPLITAVYWLLRLLIDGKRALEEELLPRLRDSAEERVRRRQRKRWEKKQGAHERR